MYNEPGTGDTWTGASRSLHSGSLVIPPLMFLPSEHFCVCAIEELLESDAKHRRGVRRSCKMEEITHS